MIGSNLDDRLYKMYDKIEDTENQLVAARAKKMAIEAEKLTINPATRPFEVFMDSGLDAREESGKSGFMKTC